MGCIHTLYAIIPAETSNSTQPIPPMKKNEHSSLDIFGYLFSLSVLKMDGSKKRHFWQLEKDNEVAPPQHGHWAYSGTCSVYNGAF